MQSRLERTDFKDLKSIHGDGPVHRKPDEAILEHNRNREIEVKMVTLEDELEEKGYAAGEIAEMLKDARARFEKEAEKKKGSSKGLTR